MKCVYIKAFISKNLGDDIFLKIVAERYKNTNFFMFSSLNYRNILPDNIILLNNLKNKICNKIMKYKTEYYLPIEINFVKKADFILQLGGSLFMEGTTKSWKSNANFLYKRLKKEYYILGSNFGPYSSKEYLNYYNDIFSNAKDVCFREEYSYNLFKELPNVRYASDIVFTLDTSNIKITNNKKVVISVIKCERKTSIEDENKYENKIIEMSEYFINKGYEVTLISYCKAEKDEEAIESILSKCNEKLKTKINTYYYRGNIEETLNIMGDCQIVVGSRFHANIIGLLLGKTVIPIAYSDKTINVLKDMNFKGKILKVQDIDKFDINSLTEADLNYKHDVSYQIKDAQRHFEKLDEVLMKED